MVHGTLEADATNGPERNPIIQRLSPLVLHLAMEVDPRVMVTLSPYRWHGEDILDIGLAFGDHEHHLQVSASRLEIIERDPHILEHDIEGAVHDLLSDLPPEATDEAGQDVPHTTPAGGLAPMVHPDAASHTAAVAVPAVVPSAPTAGHAVEPAPAVSSPEPIAAMPTPHAGDVGIRREVEDRTVLDRTIELVREMVHHLDHDAEVSFEEYPWHGELTLDVAVTLGGHVHHYEVTAERAVLFLRDHEMLHHDLEGVLIELHREQQAVGHHAAAHESETADD